LDKDQTERQEPLVMVVAAVAEEPKVVTRDPALLLVGGPLVVHTAVAVVVVQAPHLAFKVEPLE
jgi:hypothetical protein